MVAMDGAGGGGPERAARAGRRPSAWIALPWLLTLVRLALIPLFLWTALDCQRAAEAGEALLVPRARTLGVLVAIGLSDVLDGWLARRLEVTTGAGALLDATADKLAQLTILAFFVVDRAPAFASIPLPYVALLVLRDLVLVSGSLLLRRRHGQVAAEHRWHGRASTVLIFGLILALTAGAPRPLLLVLVLLSALTVVASTVDYVRYGLRQWSAGSGAAT